MSAYVHNISIDSGADYSQEYDMYEVGGRVVDLTGYSARAQIRKHRDSSTAVSFRIAFVDRSAGKIELSIPSWTTSKLKPGRYCYDVEFTKPNTEIAIVLEGKVNVRAGISTGCSFSNMGSAQRFCIAVIDESQPGHTPTSMQTKWAQFRATYPKRTFYLLQPTADGFGDLVDSTTYTLLACPSNFLNETTVNTGRLIGQ